MSQETVSVVPPACPACGAALTPGAVSCPGCGRRVAPVKGGDTVALGPRTDRSLAQAAAPDPHPSAEKAQQELPARYRALCLIGRGGMGVVFQCRDTALERDVAIKLMSDRYRTDPRAERRFLREARAQAVINHPNVATVLDVGVSAAGRPFIVMEYVEGQDLREVIRGHPGGLDPARVADLIGQVCAGLTEAHGSGIVHRDLKPSNLIVSRDLHGRDLVKILDLGLAKIIGGATDLKTITVDTADMLVGTPAYMSPEQVAGSGVDARADLYALGVVLFECLTGRLPFESETLEGWLFQQLHATPPPPSSLRPELARCPELDGLVLWALAKSPHERPQTAQELSRALQRMCATWVHGPGLAETVPGLPPLQAAPGEGRHVPSASGAVPAEVLRRIRAGGVQRAAPAGEEGLTPSDLRRDRFVALSRAAEAEEAEGKWEEAIEHWRQTLKYAENKELVTSRIEGIRRELAFEQVLSSATTLATAGDWVRAEAALASVASMRPGDRSVEQARARLPRRLIEAWLDSARARLNHFTDPAARQALLRRLAAARARAGDFAGAVRWIQEETLEVEGRVRLLAHAACAAIQAGAREGLRPYLDRALATAVNLEEPGARGRACLEMGRALAAYGDPEAAANAVENALSTFMAVGRDYQHLASPTGAPLSSGMTTRGRLVTSTRRYARLSQAARESGWENTLSALAEVQTEAGLTEAAVATAALIEDPWSRAQTLAGVVQVLARIGRVNEADHTAGTITFRLPRARALRAVAISRIYRGDLSSAEGIMRELASPEERAPVEAYLAAARYKRGEKEAAENHARGALQTAAETPGASAHLQVLLTALEPLLDVGAAELAGPYLEAAGRIVDGTEDPAERLTGLLAVGRLRARAAPPLAASSSGVPREVSENLRRALGSLRLVMGQAEREECTEQLATAIAEAGAAELATELLTMCQTECERAVAYAGLAAGLA